MTLRAHGHPLVRVVTVVEFAGISLSRQNRTGTLMRGFLVLFVFMAYGCACVQIGHFHGDLRVNPVTASPLHSTAAFGHAHYGNDGDRCHDDPPVGSISDNQAGAGLSSQRAPAVSHVLSMIGLVSAEASERMRSPPGGPSHASYPDVRSTGTTALAVLCVFRS